MNRAAALFENLADTDFDWIRSTALEDHVLRDQPVIRAGEPVRAVRIVQKGLLGVFAPGVDEKLAVVGPGGIVGDMSLLEDRAPTESVVALEPTSVLTLPHAALQERFAADPRFAAGFYRGMAKILSQRLRRTNGQLAVLQQGRDAVERTDAWRKVAPALDALEARVHQADDDARAAGGVVPEAAARALRDAYLAFYPLLNAAIGDAAPGAPELKEEVGLRVQKALLPHVLLTRNAERAYSKPRGYPCDFMSLEMIYQNVPRGSGRVGAALDRCFPESPVCDTLRSRRSLLAAEIGRTLDEAAEGEARVTCFGCGPAAEVFDAVQAHPGSERRLRATLVDFDPQALDFVAERRDRAGLRDALRTVEDDVVSLSAGRTAAEVADQDLVYGAALLDAADDALAVRLLDRMHAMLRPGGRAVLCTFLPANPCRAYMDHVLEWRVMHRDQGAVDRLFAASAFGRGATAARADAQGLALVAECVRAA